MIRWIAYLLIVLSLFAILRQLPVRDGLELIEGWITSLGVWGPVAYGCLYAILVLLLIPGSALTIAAGAIFGLFVGTIMVSIASTTGAALAFLIARYFAREKVSRAFEGNRRVAAVDRAISERGWKIVALLRLSPAVPFTLQNYLYGLTGIRFWTCILTSWVTMLPGTLMYVYLGYAGRAGIQATAGTTSRTPGEWALLIVGLLATIAVTIYVTHVARNALKEQPSLEDLPSDKKEASSAKEETPVTTRGTLIVAGLAIIMLAVAIYVNIYPDTLKDMLQGLVGITRT